MNVLNRIEYFFHKIENTTAGILLFAMAVLPTAEIFLRKIFGTGIAGSTIYVQHLTLLVGFIGAIIATRDKRHLTLSGGIEFLPQKFSRIGILVRSIVSTMVCTGLFWASLQMVRAEISSPQRIANWLPVWVIELIMPICFLVMAFRFAISLPKGTLNKVISSTGILTASLLGFYLFPYMSYLIIPLIIMLLVSSLLGIPIFVVLGGLGLLLFFNNGVPTASIPVEIFRIVTNPVLPTIPLFTLAGYILAESGASKRMIRLFKALFAWMPGGLAIAATLVCTFFTTFTGASGVTILALGGILLPVLINSGYKKKFAIGLLTATGSLGLLFPPSLPMILYGVFSGTSIAALFKNGILPGILLVLFIAVFSMIEGIKHKVEKVPFKIKEAFLALNESKWEVAIPFVVLFGIFGGYTTLVEAAAITVVYIFIVESFIYRDMNLFKDFPNVLLKCVILIGGVLIIVGVAMGLTNFIVDAEVPAMITTWAKANIHSPLVFLLSLNIILLIVGCMMDIFSALVVVVPLIKPLGLAFGIDPVHLGIIFIANLELGYLTPPVGMNLFLSAYRFDQPVIEVYRCTFKFLLLLFIAVLIITYFPYFIGMIK
ncbi:MAG: TRAP transporter large permease subunit [Candidatus Firestonebacteria bacterium]